MRLAFGLYGSCRGLSCGGSQSLMGHEAAWLPLRNRPIKGWKAFVRKNLCGVECLAPVGSTVLFSFPSSIAVKRIATTFQAASCPVSNRRTRAPLSMRGFQWVVISSVWRSSEVEVLKPHFVVTRITLSSWPSPHRRRIMWRFWRAALSNRVAVMS